MQWATLPLKVMTCNTDQVIKFAERRWNWRSSRRLDLQIAVWRTIMKLDYRLGLPADYRIGYASGSKGMHQGRHRVRRCRTHSGTRQARRSGRMRNRTSRSQQAKPE
jgi:hypothetical protein